MGMWRSLSLLIIGFWLLMSSLLVRYTWFPEGTQFSEVPVRMVLKQFLDQGSDVSTAGTLHIYRRDEKIGNATVSCRRSRNTDSDYAVRVDGMLDAGAVPNVEGIIRWGFTLKLQDVDRFGEIKGSLRFEPTRRIIDFLWQRGAAAPIINLRGDQSGMNQELVQAMVTQMLVGAGGGAGLGLVDPNAEVASLVQMKARETEMDFAGQKSKGYLLDFITMERWKVRAFITQAGELALVDLPEGYRLVEPVIHGLARDFDAEDAAELAAEEAAAAEKAKAEAEAAKQKEP